MDLQDLDLDSIGDFLNSLSQDDIDSIASIAQGFFKNDTENTNGKNAGNSESTENNPFSFDPEMIFKLMNIFQRLNSCQDDPRCRLIASLKPLLSAPRQKKADEAIRLMKIFSLFSQGDIFNL